MSRSVSSQTRQGNRIMVRNGPVSRSVGLPIFVRVGIERLCKASYAAYRHSIVRSTATERNDSVVLRSGVCVFHWPSAVAGAPQQQGQKDRRTFSTHRTFHTSSPAKERARASIMTLRAHVQVSAFLIGNQLSHD